ncbi:signal transduction histidine kinase [Chitinophaga pinensis DSM 2588]|uniref:histidine kinase n=2 Tax=Chitinophaga pinensis TaxID=79329 RepID=A0A979G6J9_CHIPD|nr:signal transduction histidine kinase [Chitinophaga pinensis DSM 2588]
MMKFLLYTFFAILFFLPVQGQQLLRKSPDELRQLLQKSEQDSNRILILHAMSRIYLNQVFGDKKETLMDTVIDIIDHAIRLSDTLHLKRFRLEGMLMKGEAYLVKGDIPEGEKRFFELAAIYHKDGDINAEAHTLVWLAMNLKWEKKDTSRIPALYDKAITLYKKVGSVDGEADVRMQLADYRLLLKQFNLAERELLQALALFRQTGNKKVSNVYYLLSVVDRYRGAYEKSLLYATKCVETTAQNTDTLDVCLFYGELALVYDELGRREESVYWYRKTLQMRIQGNIDRAVIFRTASFIISQLIKLNRKKEALALMDSLVMGGPPQTKYEKAVVAQNYAYCYDALKQYAVAEQYFLQMAGYLKDHSFDAEEVILSNKDIGRFYLQRKQFEKAHIYLNKVLPDKWQLRLTDQRELFRMLFIADSALGNYTTAIKDLQQYQSINDSLYNERKSRQIEELIIQYETDKKEQNIRLLEKEKRIQQNELLKEHNTRRWIIGATFLLIIIIGLLLNYSRLKTRTNRELKAQQKLIEKKNESLQHLVGEKEWLVKEIHHRVKNNFHMVMGLLHTQAAYLHGEEARQAITESQQRIRAMSLVHQRLYQSEDLSAINMVEYIHELIDCLKDSLHTGRAIQFNLQIDPVNLNVTNCIPIGLILNEAVTNAIKHAFPNKEGRIDISLKRMNQDHFLLIVKDNGIGLPPDFDGTKQASMGMKLMQGLSDDLDASFQVNNNNGTEILLEFIV